MKRIKAVEMECINPDCEHVWYMPEDVYDNNTSFVCAVCGKGQTKKPQLKIKVTHYTREEGGMWIEWPFENNIFDPENTDMNIVVSTNCSYIHFNGDYYLKFHSLKYSNGNIWDTTFRGYQDGVIVPCNYCTGYFSVNKELVCNNINKLKCPHCREEIVVVKVL